MYIDVYLPRGGCGVDMPVSIDKYPSRGGDDALPYTHAGMTWNAYYRDKMNRVVGIRPIRIGDANFPDATDIFSRDAHTIIPPRSFSPPCKSKNHIRAYPLPRMSWENRGTVEISRLLRFASLGTYK